MKNKNDFAALKSILIIFPIFVISILWVGGTMLHWFDKVEAPTGIRVEVDNEIGPSDFNKTEEKDGKLYITLQDKKYSTSTDSHLEGSDVYVRFYTENVAASKSPAKLKWAIEITNSNNDVQTFERDTLPAGTELHIFDPSFSLGYGKNKVKITATNRAGSFSREIVINKVSVENECEKSENKDAEICKNVREAKESDAKKKAEQEKKDEELRKSWQKNTNSSNSTNNGTSIKKNSCVHYEYGKCWDELEDRAYEDGYRDAMNGNHSYYTPGCTGQCEDIYEDAYYDGYEDGRYGL